MVQKFQLGSLTVRFGYEEVTACKLSRPFVQPNNYQPMTKLTCSIREAVKLASVLALTTGLGLTLRGQANPNPSTPVSAPAAVATPNDEPVQLDAYTVTSATRSARTIDHIPGSVMAVPNVDIQAIQAISLDPDEMLSLTIPGYSASLDDLTTSGELLRGHRPQFFLDGVLMSTPLRDVGRMAAGLTDPSVIDRIEVINGSSAIEGLGGSGGMINYITKTPTREGVFTTLDTAIETQFEAPKVGWKVTGETEVKRDNVDFLVSLGQQDRPMYYDAKGNLEYINPNGSYEDSQAQSVVAKGGVNFGPNNAQRFTIYFSNYDLKGNNNYNSVAPGNRALGIVQSAAPGAGPGVAAENFMRLTKADYTNSDVFGGTIHALGYFSQENIVNGPGVIDPSKQDPNYAPIGTLVDVSQIVSDKNGAKIYWVRENFLVEGLEFNAGYDYAHDGTYQNLILTNRTWLPPLDYTGHSGYAQLEYDHGQLTLAVGARYQYGSIAVPTFRTLYETAPATDGVVFTGGSKSYTTAASNAGATWRFTPNLSAYVGFSQGYDLPDIGTVIRNTTKPNQSLQTVAALSAILSDNYETGINWHNGVAALGADVYYNHSPATTLVVTDPTTLIQTISRTPVVREGMEFTGEWKITPEIKVSGTYSKMLAYTSNAPGLPVNVTITPSSTAGQEPDKAVLRLDWAPINRLSFGLVGQNYWFQEFNVGRVSTTGTSLYWRESGYAIVDGSVTYRTNKWGIFSVGVSNINNAFHILTQTGTSNTNYYSIQGRKFVFSNKITF